VNEKSKIIIINRYIRYDDKIIIGVEHTLTDDEVINCYLNLCGKEIIQRLYSIPKNKTTEELLTHLNIIPTSKPDTLPKFDGSVPLYFYTEEITTELRGLFDREKYKFSVGGDVEYIRWGGDKWSYKLKNVGEKYFFIPEEKLFIII